MHIWHADRAIRDFYRADFVHPAVLASLNKARYVVAPQKETDGTRLELECFIIENWLAAAQGGGRADVQVCFYRSGGAEIDLLLAWPDGELRAIENKRSLTPKLERGFHAACADLKPSRKFMVYPGQERYPLAHDIEAISLSGRAKELYV